MRPAVRGIVRRQATELASTLSRRCLSGRATLLEMLTPRTQPAPFYVEENGAARVVGTRFPIEFIIENWLAGESPEVIAQSFVPLDLEKVYTVVAYYLSHREELDAYLAELDANWERLKEEMAAAGVLGPSTEELLKRRAGRRAGVPG